MKNKILVCVLRNSCTQIRISNKVCLHNITNQCFCEGSNVCGLCFLFSRRQRYFLHIEQDLSPIRLLLVTVTIDTISPLRLSCQAAYCCTSYTSQLDRTNVCFPYLAACMTPPGIMKVSPKEGVFQVRANSNLPSPVFKVFSVFSNTELPFVSEREPKQHQQPVFLWWSLRLPIPCFLLYTS